MFLLSDTKTGWLGKGKSSGTQAASEHTSRPLATLKDPAAFGPPPKNVNYHGGAALPNEITPHRSGLGAPLTPAELAVDNHQVEEESTRPAAPALPYRSNTTGVRTDNLPPPPVHRSTQSALPPPPPTRTAAPRPPPRLPARQNTNPSPSQEIPPPSYTSVTPEPAADPYINQSSVSNLSRAGVKVPGFGIGSGNDNPWSSEKSKTSGGMSELQSRFGRMNGSQTAQSTQNDPATSPAELSTGMPSWKQSQSAFSTAQTLRTNPQNVTLADAQNAAQTANQAHTSANAFRERHADSIAKGQAKAKAWDQKYKVTSKLNKFLDDQEQNQQTQTQPQANVPPTTSYTAPPPIPQHPAVTQPQQVTQTPAPRKPANLQAPPPVPTGTKPAFG